MPYLAATKDFLMGFRKDVVPNVHYGKELKVRYSVVEMVWQLDTEA